MLMLRYRAVPAQREVAKPDTMPPNESRRGVAPPGWLIGGEGVEVRPTDPTVWGSLEDVVEGNECGCGGPRTSERTGRPQKPQPVRPQFERKLAPEDIAEAVRAAWARLDALSLKRMG